MNKWQHSGKDARHLESSLLEVLVRLLSLLMPRQRTHPPRRPRQRDRQFEVLVRQATPGSLPAYKCPELPKPLPRLNQSLVLLIQSPDCPFVRDDVHLILGFLVNRAHAHFHFALKLLCILDLSLKLVSGVKRIDSCSEMGPDGL